MKRIIIFHLPNGTKPFEEWRGHLSGEVRVWIDTYITRVAQGGSKSNIRALKAGVFEIKINRGPGGVCTLESTEMTLFYFF